MDIPDEGKAVWLKNFGQVTLFRTQLKNQYVVYLTDTMQFTIVDRKDFVHQHGLHWQIEQYHRVIKQVYNIESVQVRGKVPILNHLFTALCSYVHLTNGRVADVIYNTYRLQKDLFKEEVVATFINSCILDKDYLNPKFWPIVNA